MFSHGPNPREFQALGAQSAGRGLSFLRLVDSHVMMIVCEHFNLRKNDHVIVRVWLG